MKPSSYLHSFETLYFRLIMLLLSGFLVKSDLIIGLFVKRFQVNSPIVLPLSHQVDIILEFLKKHYIQLSGWSDLKFSQYQIGKRFGVWLQSRNLCHLCMLSSNTLFTQPLCKPSPDDFFASLLDTILNWEQRRVIDSGQKMPHQLTNPEKSRNLTRVFVL